MKPLRTIVFALLIVPLAAASARAALPSAQMDYRDAEEIAAAMEDLAAAHPDLVVREWIGGSVDSVSVPTLPTYYPVYALRIGPTGTPPPADADDPIPSILFVGGIHGREWLGSESLMAFAEHLAERAQDPGTSEYGLLRKVAVWIIPVANPAGRMIDDLAAGDPNRYYTGLGNTEFGWRHSGDPRGCVSATDPGRNFSTGWNTASGAACTWDDHFKGLAPFSTSEAVALRQFVQNHAIAMVVDVHTSSQRIWNRWGNADTAGQAMRARALEIWNRGIWNFGARIYDQPPASASLWRRLYWALTMWDFTNRFTLDQIQTGTTDGQLTAWLGDEQHMQCFVLELPPWHERVDYYGSELRHATTDDSNSFHPSSDRVRALVQNAVIPVAFHLAEQAYAPSAATSPGYVYDDDSQSASIVYLVDPTGARRHDHGFLAAKIGDAPDAAGLLTTVPAFLQESSPGVWSVTAPAYDYLPPNQPGSSYQVLYWVQNYSRSLSWRDPVVSMTLRSRPHDLTRTDYPTLEASAERRHRLSTLGRAQDAFELTVADDKDYELVLRVRERWSLSNDQLRENDVKVFRFSTVGRFDDAN